MKRLCFEGLRFDDAQVSGGDFQFVVENACLYQHFTNFTGVIAVLPDRLAIASPSPKKPHRCADEAGVVGSQPLGLPAVHKRSPLARSLQLGGDVGRSSHVAVRSSPALRADPVPLQEDDGDGSEAEQGEGLEDEHASSNGDKHAEQPDDNDDDDLDPLPSFHTPNRTQAPDSQGQSDLGACSQESCEESLPLPPRRSRRESGSPVWARASEGKERGLSVSPNKRCLSQSDIVGSVEVTVPSQGRAKRVRFSPREIFHVPPATTPLANIPAVMMETPSARQDNGDFDEMSPMCSGSGSHRLDPDTPPSPLPLPDDEFDLPLPLSQPEMGGSGSTTGRIDAGERLDQADEGGQGEGDPESEDDALDDAGSGYDNVPLASIFSSQPTRRDVRGTNEDGACLASPVFTLPQSNVLPSPGLPSKKVVLEWEECATKGEAAPARWGHGGVVLARHNRLVVIGGQDSEFRHLNDTFSLDLGSMLWKKQKSPEHARAWFGCVPCSDNDVLLVGGQTNNANPRPVQGNEELMLMYDSRYNVWITATCAGERPKPMLGAATVQLDPDHVLVFGGKLQRVLSSRVCVLNTRTWEWSQPNIVGSSPQPRVYCGACVAGTDVVVFGGNDDHQTFEDVWVLDTSKWTWRKLKTKGEGPTPRSGLKMVALSPRHVLVHGGSDDPDGGDYLFFDDHFVLDLVSRRWSRPEVKGEVLPSGRSGHVLVPCDGSQFVCFGGHTAAGVCNKLFRLRASLVDQASA